MIKVKQEGCVDVICSNFVDKSSLKCVRKIKVPDYSIIPRCHFQNGTLRPRVVLKSFPGSGNTWTRQLLEKTTGICTGIGIHICGSKIPRKIAIYTFIF